MRFDVGDRVKVRVGSHALWKGAWESRPGDPGTVTGTYPRWGSYAVLLDGDPDQCPAVYRKDELEAER